MAKPKHRDEALTALGWSGDDLDRSIAPAVAYAGAWHLVLAVAKADRLANLDYDFEKLKALMLRENLTTLQLIWREEEFLFHSRNPFPIGGIVEDPATGAAALAQPLQRWVAIFAMRVFFRHRHRFLYDKAKQWVGPVG